MKHEVSIGESIKLGGFDIAIHHDRERELEANNFRGLYSSYRRELSFDPKLLPQEFSATVCHEFAEAINDVWCDGSLEHGQITNLSNGLHQVFEQLGVRFVK